MAISFLTFAVYLVRLVMVSILNKYRFNTIVFHTPIIKIRQYISIKITAKTVYNLY